MKKIRIDLRDLHYLRKGKFYVDRSRPKTYVSTLWLGKKQYVHRLILNASGEETVDHINGDVLDNRRCNLRLCSLSQNGANKYQRNLSGFKGVYFYAGKYNAAITANGKCFHITRTDDPYMAALMYDAVAEEWFGEFAATNADLKLVGTITGRLAVGSA